MKSVSVFLIVAGLFAPSWAEEATSTDEGVRALFIQGQNAFDSRDYYRAVALFEQAIDKSQSFNINHYLWLGPACELAYKAVSESAKPDSIFLLEKGVLAFKTAFTRHRDPSLQYDWGRLRTYVALERARFLITRDLPSQRTFEPQPQGAAASAQSDTLQAIHRQAVLDSLNHLWQEAEGGLAEMWEAILTRERKDWVYLPVGPVEEAISDTLSNHLSIYVEYCLKVAESASDVDFAGVDPTPYLPRIENACRRGQNGTNADWFTGILHEIHFGGGFEGGGDMRCVIYRLKGLRQSREQQEQKAIETLGKAIHYARSDTSIAALYFEMTVPAYYAYGLLKAVEYAQKAYEIDPWDQRFRRQYGDLSLNLAATQLKEGNPDKAILYILPVTQFEWPGRGEALIVLMTAYLKTDWPDALDKAFAAAYEAYQIDPDKYWKELNQMYELRGEFEQALYLAQQHGDQVP